VPENDEAPTASVHEAIVRVMQDIGAIAKDRENVQQQFKFRGVDDVMNALAEPLRKHGVFVIPEVRHASTEVRQGARNLMNATRLRMAFHFVGPAGDRVTAITEGEGVDVADKSTNKAMAAAFKYALLYLFMIPTKGTLDDGDEDHEPGTVESEPDLPDQRVEAAIRISNEAIAARSLDLVDRERVLLDLQEQAIVADARSVTGTSGRTLEDLLRTELDQVHTAKENFDAPPTP
jgi:hypothetical protein